MAKSSVNDILRETQAFFNDQGMSMLNVGYNEIISDQKYRGALVEALTEGVDADNRAEMSQLLQNAAKQTLTESLGGITPLSSLSMPVIRKLWPKCAMKNAVKTIVATAPIFTISYTKPYLTRVTEKGEERMELPRGVFKRNGQVDKYGNTAGGFGNEIADEIDMQYVTEEVKVEANGIGKFQTVKFVKDAKDAAKFPLDADFELVSVTFSNDASSSNGEIVLDHASWSTSYENLKSRLDSPRTVSVGEKMGIKPEIIADVHGLAKWSGDNTSYINNVQVIVRINQQAGTADVAVLGDLAPIASLNTASLTVTLRAHKSSEWNEESWDVSFDIARQDVRIGTGTHLNAPLSIEYLQDVQALYNIDATAEVTDLMTNFFAQKLDLELVDFLDKCFLNRPTNKEFQGADYGDANAHVYSFNVAPDAGFAGGPKAWREELKTVIEYAATSIISETYFTEGTFVIVGHPLDVALISNVDWQYKGGNGGNVDGVNVSYDIGVLSGAYTFKVVQSLNYPSGRLMISFIPAGDKQLTQAYYPYTFTMEKGYRDPNHPNVPALVMTKRDTKFEYMPSTAVISIIGNDGKGQFHGGNVWKHDFK